MRFALAALLFCFACHDHEHEGEDQTASHGEEYRPHIFRFGSDRMNCGAMALGTRITRRRERGKACPR